MKKIYTILMTLVLLAAALPLQAQTTVYYLDSDNDKQKAESASELTSVSSGSTGKEISGYWYATGAVEVKAPLIVSGEATLILCRELNILGFFLGNSNEKRHEKSCLFVWIVFGFC